MRRKNVYVTIGLILVLFLVHSAGLPLAYSALDEAFAVQGDGTSLFCGKVVRIEEKDTAEYQIEVRLDTCNDQKLRKKESILVTLKGELPETTAELFNRTVSFRSTLKEPAVRRNPGCFDYSLYLKSQGIFYTASVDRLTSEADERGPAEKAEAWLISMRMKFTRWLNPVSKGLICGILFGDTSVLSEDTYEEFRNNGTAHILAVSGLHIGILYGLYKKIVGKRRSFAAMVLLGLSILCYGTVSMWSPSVVRASMMIGLHLLAKSLDLRYDMLTGLSTVALLLILQNPYVIYSAGFQMSFMAIASICFLQPILPEKIPETMRVVVAVNLGLMLYQMFQFNYVSLVSLLANIPVVYLTGILVPAALICFLWFIVSGGNGNVMDALEFIMDSLSYLLLEINSVSTLGGRGSMDIVSPPLWVLISVYLLMFFLSSEQCLVLVHRKKWRSLAKYIAAAILAGCIFSGLLTSPVSRADLVFVDVGQGDCVHIRDGNRDVLIDGGGSWNYSIGEGTLKPYLLKNGAWNVDLALATHEHMDHYQGLQELAEVYSVKQLKSGLTAGETVRISEDVWIETLWPLELDPETGQDENHLCSVFMIHYEGWNILITGDLDEQGEREMMEYYESTGQEEKLRADVLKVGHHGSRTSTCEEFLDTVQPKVAVIQVGVYNIYGHPHGKTIEKCQERGIMVYRNDYNGGIGFLFEEEAFQIDTVIS